jgi:hypothetical protein
MVSRRSVLASIALLTGCVGSDPSDSPDSPTGTERSGSTDTTEPASGTDPADENESSADGKSTGSASADGTPTDSSDGLDIREANVMAVEWEGTRGGEVEFSVTLYHDDEGEDGYANWWQVETLHGERLGRRELLHAHGTRTFTRSKTIAVPGDWIGWSCAGTTRPTATVGGR